MRAAACSSAVLMLFCRVCWAKVSYYEEHNILPSDYTREFHPWTSLDYAGTLDVKIYLTIVSISMIDEEKSSVHMSLLLRCIWMDDRILLPEGMTGDAHISFSALLRERLWVPDLFFLHATSIRRQKLFTPSEALQVYANKTIFLSSLYVKLMMEYSCPMKYTSYPLDRQSCDIIMESSGYPKERLNISWHPAGVRLPSQLHNHQFSVSISSGYHSQSTYPSGTYSAVGFRLNLQRKVQFYLLQAYLPESGPRVSYIKAMDVWMIGCMMFCFCCTVEYAVIIRFEQITNFSCTGHHQSMTGDAHISFSPLMRERLWVPDLFFLHATSIRQLKLYTPSEALQVYANKTIFLASLYVKLVRRNRPPRFQFCGYPSERLNISWHPAGVRLPSQLYQHQFSVSISSGYNSQSAYPSGTYAAIGFRLDLQRKMQFYLLQTYLPQAGPRVSYVKAMDVWMIGCMVFCFYSTVEYALVIRCADDLTTGTQKTR
ncbi:glycine receptor subunit alphaZ1-like [Pollicipes pollicipes]|uniref:glycine receptor subunit alphaZ1-like n=1 Tax=Pollicipes pollicipes TaxID=41117 RepID=UPI001884EF49|nr:glycine receptor subunit alphaZ1-like [Pollicipes pollicipes]